MNTNSNDSVQLFVLETLYKDNLPGLLRYARRFVPSEVANDLVQDVFFRLWRGSRTFFDVQDDKMQQMYLYRSVNNACKDWLKHQIAISNHAAEAMYLLQLETMNLEDSDPDLFEERLKRVTEQVALLPERCRMIFQMHYRQMRSSMEIAKYFGISQRTVEAQLYKALQILRKTLKSDTD